MRRWAWAGALATLLAWLPATLAGAVTLRWSAADPFGLAQGFACVAGAESCSASQVLSLDAAAPSSGALEVTDPFTAFAPADGALSIQLPEATFTGATAGIDEVVLRSVELSVSSLSALPIPDGDGYNLVLAGGTEAALITGSLEQRSGGATVLGPTDFSVAASLTALNCLVDASFAGTCGFTFGATGDFVLALGGDGAEHEFVTTFNQVVAVPEPGAALLVLALGAASLGLRGGGPRRV